MPAINDRSGDNASRKGRIAKLKKGPGVFVYNGTQVDTEWTPTILTVGGKTPALNAQGMPVLDRSGRQTWVTTGSPVLDEKGIPMLGGPPKKTTRKLDTVTVWGIEFKKGAAVKVDNSTLALRLRGKDCFEEVDEEDEVTEKPIADMTKAELLDLAKNEGIEIPSGSSKSEIAAILEAKAS